MAKAYTNGNNQHDAATLVMPHDGNAEKAIIGSALIDSDAYNIAASMGLSPDAFYLERNRVIWQAMEYMAARNEPTSDLVLVENELRTAGDLDTAGGASYLLECATSTPSAVYVSHYAKIALARAVQRRVITAGSAMVRAAYEFKGDDPTALLDTVSQMQGDLYGESSAGFVRASDVLPTVLDEMEAGTSLGMPTGYGDLDRLVGGMRRGDLLILAGRPAMGKSALAQNVVNNVCKRGGRVALFNLEMTNTQTVQRIISQETKVPLTRIRLGGDNLYDDEWTVLVASAALISDFDLHLLDTAQVSISQLRGMARNLKRVHNNLDLVVVDYLQLLGSGKSFGPDENRQQEVSFISRSLKILARELDVPVLALSQLSRAVESRADKRPMLSDLRESGSLEQDADVVMFVYREDYYVPDTDRANIADVIVAKARNAATGTVSMFFRKENTDFRPLEVTRETLTY